jgi:hypothetical protein
VAKVTVLSSWTVLKSNADTIEEAMKAVYWIGYGIVASACAGGVVALRTHEEAAVTPPWKVAIQDGTVIRLQNNLARSYDSPPPVVDDFAGNKFVVPPPPANLPALPAPEFPEPSRR